MFYAVNVLIAAYFALWADSLGEDVTYWVAFLYMAVAFFALLDSYWRDKREVTRQACLDEQTDLLRRSRETLEALQAERRGS